MSLFLSLAALLPLAVAAQDAAPPPAPLTPVEQKAKVYEDLGPDAIDVSRYPAARREQYLVFKRNCEQCHTLARPINAPFTTAADWRRFIRRMRGKAVFSHGKTVTTADAATIADFLAFDAKQRKLAAPQEWAHSQRTLQAWFFDVQRRRLLIEDEEARKKAKEDAMGPEVRPQGDAVQTQK